MAMLPSPKFKRDWVGRSGRRGTWSAMRWEQEQHEPTATVVVSLGQQQQEEEAHGLP